MEAGGLILVGMFIGAGAMYVYLRKSGKLAKGSGVKGSPGGGGRDEPGRIEPH